VPARPRQDAQLPCRMRSPPRAASSMPGSIAARTSRVLTRTLTRQPHSSRQAPRPEPGDRANRLRQPPLTLTLTPAARRMAAHSSHSSRRQHTPAWTTSCILSRVPPDK